MSKKTHKLTRAMNWIAAIVIILEVLINLWVIVSYHEVDKKNPFGELWFKHFQYFTYQSNIFLMVMFCMYFMQLGRTNKNRLFSTNSFILYSMVYIMLTFFVYVCILSWQPTEFGQIHTWGDDIDYYWYIQNVFSHMIFPLLAFTWFIIALFAPRFFNYRMVPTRFFWKYLLIGFIYPLLFILYADLLSTISYFSKHDQMIVYPYITVFVGQDADVTLSILFPVIALCIISLCMFFFWYLDWRILTNPNKKNIVDTPPITTLKG